MVSCEVCDKEFSSEKAVRMHKMRMHKQPRISDLPDPQWLLKLEKDAEVQQRAQVAQMRLQGQGQSDQELYARIQKIEQDMQYVLGWIRWIAQGAQQYRYQY